MWYFAYGSNLSRRKMLKTIAGRWREECVGTARGFEVVFNKRSTLWGAAANLAAAPRKTCHGVLYKTTPTFVALPKSITDSPKPSDEYLKIIVEGGREHGLPQSYLQELVRKAKKVERRDVR